MRSLYPLGRAAAGWRAPAFEAERVVAHVDRALRVVRM
jgi:hypothetical protein